MTITFTKTCFVEFVVEEIPAKATMGEVIEKTKTRRVEQGEKMNGQIVESHGETVHIKTDSGMIYYLPQHLVEESNENS